MKILNNTLDVPLTINGNTVAVNESIVVGEAVFNSQAIYSSAGSVEIITEHCRRSFRNYGYLKAYESTMLIDTGGMPVVVVIDTIPRRIYKNAPEIATDEISHHDGEKE